MSNELGRAPDIKTVPLETLIQDTILARWSTGGPPLPQLALDCEIVNGHLWLFIPHRNSRPRDFMLNYYEEYSHLAGITSLEAFEAEMAKIVVAAYNRLPPEEKDKLGNQSEAIRTAKKIIRTSGRSTRGRSRR